MKKLFAVLFLVGSVATLRADYYDAGYQSQYYPQSNQYYSGYSTSPSYGYQSYGTPSYGYQSYGTPSYDYQSQAQCPQQAQPQYQGQAYQGQAQQGQAYQNGQAYQGDRSMPASSYQGQAYQRENGMPASSYQGQAYQRDNGAPASSYQGQPGAAQSNDQRLTADIQDSLRSRFSDKYNNVQVTVNNGNITLRGTVASEDDKADLEEKVRDMDGVRSVNNQVTIQNSQARNRY